MRKTAVPAFVCLVLAAVTPPSARAAMLDLTAEGSWATVNGAMFRQYSDTGAGSGNIDAFVRIQSFGVQQGYNTDARPVEFDEDSSATFTHSLLLNQVPIVTDNGTNYREFLLDINQNNQSILSLDKLKIALHASGGLYGYLSIFSAPIYDLDAGQDNWIKLDYSLNGGSGQGDMLAYIPDSFFMDESGAYLNDYVYLYSRFGENSIADDGFEEWAHGLGGPVIPEPAAILLLALGGLIMLRPNRKAQANPAS